MSSYVAEQGCCFGNNHLLNAIKGKAFRHSLFWHGLCRYYTRRLHEYASFKNVLSHARAVRGARTTVVAIGILAGATTLAVAHNGGVIDLRDNSGFGRASGTIEWSDRSIRLVGAMSGSSRSSSLWLHSKVFGTTHNELVQTAQAGRIGHFKRKFSFVGGPSDITLTLCSDQRSKGCGARQRF